MAYGDYPARTEPEDLLKVCQSLREGGRTEDEIEGDDELDVGRDTVLLGSYLGFIENNEEGVLTLTDRGTQLGYRDDLSEATEPIFVEGIKQYSFFGDLTDHLFNEKGKAGTIEQKEILPELRTEFGIRELSDDMVKRITRVYLKTLHCAGFGEFLIGRGGKATRIELEEDVSDLVSDVTSTGGSPDTDDGVTQDADEEEEAEKEASGEEPPSSGTTSDGNKAGRSESYSPPDIDFDQKVGGTKVEINIDISSGDWESEEVINFLNKLRATSD